MYFCNGQAVEWRRQRVEPGFFPVFLPVFFLFPRMKKSPAMDNLSIAKNLGVASSLSIFTITEDKIMLLEASPELQQER
jgi:hypothetical protein